MSLPIRSSSPALSESGSFENLSQSTPLISNSSLRQDIVEAFFESPAQAESTKRMVARIAFTAGGIFLCFAAEIPSILNAKAFDAFPGASQISAGAVLVYSFFGADNILELSRELFPTSSDVHQKMTAGKVVRISLALLLGIFSRFRGAGLTLHVVPGIAQYLRLPLAILKIIGTCAPEVFSVYSSLGMKFDSIRRFFNPNDRETFLLMTRENVLKCLKAAKARLIENAGTRREQLLDELNSVQNGSMANLPQRLFNRIVTNENHERAMQRDAVYQSRTWVRVGLGTLTSVGTTCSLILSAVLAKYADNTFFPGGDAEWKWALAVISALTIAYTAYTKSFQGANNAVDALAAPFGAEQDWSLGRTMYPKSHALFTSVALFLVAALYGDHYESVNGSLGVNTILGKAVLSGIVFAAFFLYSQAMQGVFDKGARGFAKSRFAEQENKDLTLAVEKLEKLEKIVASCSLDEYADLIQDLDLTHEQKRILLCGIEFEVKEVDVENPTDVSPLEELLANLKINDASELTQLPEPQSDPHSDPQSDDSDEETPLLRH